MTQYLKLAEHYLRCLKKNGDSAKGMDWQNEESSIVRHQVMYELYKDKVKHFDKKIKILDFGCGTSHFYDYLLKSGLEKNCDYIGMDINTESIKISQKKFPNNTYKFFDIHTSELSERFDYIVINGVFTQRLDLTVDYMDSFMFHSIEKLYAICDYGLAFNFMSEFVDYKKDGAYHPDLYNLLNFLTQNISRNFIFRNDYGLFESTIYLYKI